MELIINTDGASRGNPGPAAYGFVVRSNNGQILYQEGQTIGVTTNNLAEYTAVLQALSYVKNHLSKSLHQIEVMTDSQLVAAQLSGRYKVKKPHLKELLTKIKILEYELGRVFYQHVPRADNQLADQLANQALDKDRLSASQ